MEKLYFIFVIILGSVLYNVAEVSTQSEWDSQQFINSMQRWFETYQQQSASANETGKIEDQTASKPIYQLVSDVEQRFVPSRDNERNSNDLKDAMVYLNASFGFSSVPGNNRTHNGSDDQVESFFTMFNAAASALLTPDSIANYLNSLKNESSDLSPFASDDAITVNSDDLSKQFIKEYEESLRRYAETLHSNKTNDTTGASQNHVNDQTREEEWPKNGN